MSQNATGSGPPALCGCRTITLGGGLLRYPPACSWLRSRVVLLRVAPGIEPFPKPARPA